MTDIHNIQKLIERRKELRKNSTKEEDILWKELRSIRLGYKFRRQHSIGGYIADFYCAKARLVIEVDGSSHDNPDQKEYDSIRDEFLKSLHHSVLRFKNKEIGNKLNEVISQIKISLSNLSGTPLLT